jgi:hypothetical protein
MAQKQCGKCGELVDEAKAFCPGCGNAFVQEQVREETSFEKMDNTLEFGQTMYNQMLSDMGLSVDKLVSPEGEPIRPPYAIDAGQTQAGNRAEIQKPGWSGRTWAILVLSILGTGIIALVAIAIILFFISSRIS